MDETHIADHSPFTLTYAETLMTKIRSLATADVMGVMFDEAKGNTPQHWYDSEIKRSFIFIATFMCAEIVTNASARNQNVKFLIVEMNCEAATISLWREVEQIFVTLSEILLRSAGLNSIFYVLLNYAQTHRSRDDKVKLYDSKYVYQNCCSFDKQHMR